jgi:hypothetical protein
MEPPPYVGTLPNKGNNNGTVLQGAFKGESPQKQTKPIRSSTILSFQSTEPLKNNTPPISSLSRSSSRRRQLRRSSRRRHRSRPKHEKRKQKR